MQGLIKADITIIGAGPAGLAAALALAQRNVPCLLVDKHQFPREKICGDGLSGKVLSALDRLNPAYAEELSRTGMATGSHAARFFSPSSKMMELSFKTGEMKHPPGLICRRYHFDNFLYDKASASPFIRFTGNYNAEKITRNGDTLIISGKDQDRPIETRLVLFAAGASHKLIRQLDPGYPGKTGEGVGVRGYFQGVTGADHLHAIEIHFLKELLPWYLWIFPFGDGSANVGLALPESLARKNPDSLKDLLFKLIEKYPQLRQRFSGARLTGKIAAGRLPYYTGPVKLSGDNYMLLGDAARLIDPFTGEGIGNAMLSGMKSAATAAWCMANNDFSARATSSYETDIREKLVPDLETGLKLQHLARKALLLNLVIGKASRNEKIRMAISEMLYDPKAKNQLSRSSFYLKLIFGI